MQTSFSSRLLGALFVAAGIAAAPVVANAQTASSAWQPGDFVVRVGEAGVLPLDTNSHIDTIGGSVSVSNSTMPEVDFSYFFTSAISVQLIATSTRHEVSANNTALTPLLGSKIKLGSAYVLPPALVAQYHFFPDAEFRPYVGAGLDVAWFYDSNPATEVIPGTSNKVVNKFTLSNTVGPVLNVGVDYHVSGNWFANFDIKEIYSRPDAVVNTAIGEVKAHDGLNPLVISGGIAYRF